MKDQFKFALCLILIIMLLPLFVTLIISGIESCPVADKADIEDYLPAVVAMEIPWDYSKEAILAQTIVSRTNLYKELEEGTASDRVERAISLLKKKEMNNGFLNDFQIFQDAALETEGQVLSYEGEIKEVPFHRISAGKTRDGEEILGESYPYLPSVEAEADISGEEYLNGTYLTDEEIEKKLRAEYSGFSWERSGDEKIKILKSDTVGYVLEIQAGNLVFQGEEFRRIMGLESSCFAVEFLGEETRFLCKGIGHGLGMSQYTADVFSKEGKNYQEILDYFYPDMKIESIDKFSINE